MFWVKYEIYDNTRYKARLVIKGFQEKRGVNYVEIFFLVVKMTIIKLVLGIVDIKDLHITWLDVKKNFLHGFLEEDIYMAQIDGFLTIDKENIVYNLKKGQYGLKKAPRQ